MIRALRRKPRFRAVLLGLLALCVVLQPVLAASGDLHELLEHPEQVVMHLDGTGHHDTAGTAAGDPAEFLHTLLHVAHCCGQSVGFDLTIPGAGWTPASDSRPLNPATAPTLQLRRGTPFRPPIQA
jgi:hypothetical protein